MSEFLTSQLTLVKNTPNKPQQIKWKLDTPCQMIEDSLEMDNDNQKIK